MNDAAQELMTSMLSAYAGYIERRLQELGVDRPPSFDDALAEGRAWLQDNLEALLLQQMSCVEPGKTGAQNNDFPLCGRQLRR